MRVLLVSTYDLGRQPYGLASPAAWFRRAGVAVECADTSRDPLTDAQLAAADIVAFYLPMHTATRLAGPVIARARAVNPAATLAAYGLYAPLNAAWLRGHGVDKVFGPEAEAELVALVTSACVSPSVRIGEPSGPPGRLAVIQPDRSTLPALSRYATLQMPDGSRRVVGTTDATRGCKHLCRHCPIVPVYRGTFRAMPLDVVMADIGAQIAAGAEHITFGDPDFFNGPTHARRLVERLSREYPDVTYDVTIKIEHLLKHADMLHVLRATGCLFITSAVESVDDCVLGRLRKRHTRADFERAVVVCREADVPLAPTFVAFTPWTTLEGYVDLLQEIERLGLVEAVAPIQLAIRLLVTSDSALLELPEIRGVVEPFDAQSLTWPWRHRDPRVDGLQQHVMHVVATTSRISRTDAFDRIAELAYAEANLSRRVLGSDPSSTRHRGLTPPYLSEGWYCCAEPGPELLDVV